MSRPTASRFWFFLQRIFGSIAIALTILAGVWTATMGTSSYLGPYLQEFGFVLIFLVYLLLVLFFGFAFLVYSYHKLARRMTDSKLLPPQTTLTARLQTLQRDNNRLITSARALVRTVYGNDSGPPRINIVSLNCAYRVTPNGDTFGERKVQLVCGPKPAHFWEFFIDADEEAEPLSSFAELSISVKDSDTGREIDWIPIEEKSHLKRIAIFFPELEPDKKKNMTIKFSWPGYMRKLLQNGTTEFWWSYRSHDLKSNLAKVRYEWTFESGCPEIRPKLGQASLGLLRTEETGGAQKIVYYDEKELTDGNRRSIRLETVG